MLFLSQYDIPLNDARELTDTFALHRAVYRLFPDAGNSADNSSIPLFADKGECDNVRRILILSDRQPELPENGSMLCKKIPENWLEAPDYQFTIVLNAVQHDETGGRELAMCDLQSVGEWFCKEVSAWGFELKEAMLESITPDRFTAGNNTVMLNKATLSGVLHVTDRERFIRSFSEGIGTGRAFGCGLLQIVPLV